MVRWRGESSVDPGTSHKSIRIVVTVALVLALIILLILAGPIYFWLTSKEKEVQKGPCNYNLSAPLLNPEFYSNGSVAGNGVVYPAGYHFRVDGTIRGCLCALKPCIRKCCAQDEYFVKVPRKRATCQKNSETSPFYNLTLPVYLNPRKIANVSSDHFRFLFGDVCSFGKYMLNPAKDPSKEYNLMVDGKILLEDRYLDASMYCMESVNGSDEIRTMVCFTPIEDAEEEVQFTLYPIGMMVSVAFMIVTFLVYSVISVLRNLHGKCMMSYTSSLIVTYIGLTIIQVNSHIPFFWCRNIAFTMQFAFLASFFWLNVMCFDIWWVFSGWKAPQGSAKESDHKFAFYSLYAWGVPSIILVITMVMDLVPSIPDSFIKPGFGERSCWFKNNEGTLLYFYLPIAIIMLLNITMFVTTAFKLKAHTKETKVLHSSESRQSNKADKDRFNLYLKLFIVMGINWVMELVSFFVGGPKSLWFVPDILNTLQGVLIFVIFVCKRRVLRLVKQKLCPTWDFSTISSFRQSNSSNVTTSSILTNTSSGHPSSIALKSVSGDNPHDNKK